MLMWPNIHVSGPKSLSTLLTPWINWGKCNDVNSFECFAILNIPAFLSFLGCWITLKAYVEMMDSCRVMIRLGLLALGTLLWANTYCWVCLCMSTPLWKDSLSPWMSNLGLLALQKDPLVCLWKQTPSVWIWRGTLHPFNSGFGVSLTLGVSDPLERDRSYKKVKKPQAYRRPGLRFSLEEALPVSEPHDNWV